MPINSELKDAIVEKFADRAARRYDDCSRRAQQHLVKRRRAQTRAAAAEATLENDRKELAAIKAKESSEENSFILGAGGLQATTKRSRS